MSGNELVAVTSGTSPPEDCLTLGTATSSAFGTNRISDEAWLRDLDSLATALRVRHTREAQVGAAEGTLSWRAAQQKLRMRSRGFPAAVEGGSTSLSNILQQREDLLVASLTRLFDEVADQISSLEVALTQHSSSWLGDAKDGASAMAAEHYRARCHQLLSSAQRQCCLRGRSLMQLAWYAWSDVIMYKVSVEPAAMRVERTTKVQLLAADMVWRQRNRMCYAHCFSAWQEAYSSSHSTNAGHPRAQGMPSKDRVDLLSKALERTLELLIARDASLAEAVGGLGQLLLDEWKNASEAISSAQALLDSCREKQLVRDTCAAKVDP
mmetsp:Transcript_58699/g.131216  ORF Transcript_58699/g.131216 Transcript_58699/m.131216 type:complete len:324 (-) Transcript_58699:44-1015(-)